MNSEQLTLIFEMIFFGLVAVYTILDSEIEPKLEKNSQGQTIILINTIAYLESDSNYTIIYLKTGKSFISSFTLKHHIEKLEGVNHFYRISRGHFINVDYIRTKDDKYVILKNGKQMLISRRRLKQLDEFLNQQNVNK